MEFRNCPVCNRPFMYIGRKICNVCFEVEEKEFNAVRKYLQEHKGARVSEVSEATGVNVDKIVRFLREGRLVSADIEAGEYLTCSSCGTQIREGKLCEACARKFTETVEKKGQYLKSHSEPPATKTTKESKKVSARMHTARGRD